MSVDTEKVLKFLFREAQLADENRYDEWLSLWGHTIRYCVPCSEDAVDATRHTFIIIDDRRRLEERIARLKSGAAHCQHPPSRLRRVIGNVEIAPTASENVIEVWSNFILFEARSGRQHIYAGRTKHLLEVQDEGDIKMVEKWVFLANSNDPQGNLTFLV